MATHTPAPATDPITFTPVPVSPRRDGWTAERQRAFIHALATTGCVTEACAAVGKSGTSAYALRKRPTAAAFAAAWNAALHLEEQRRIAVAIASASARPARRAAPRLCPVEAT